MPKIVCISDTHNLYGQIRVPDGDILIHAGDATNGGTIEEIKSFNCWFAGLPHRHKIFVAGNHDWLFETNRRQAESLLDAGIVYLQDSSIEIENLKIYGSPWQPRFFNWAFNLSRGAEMREKWRLISAETDVLITHGPPHGILDTVARLDSVELTGCEDLRAKVAEINPQLHIFGHIHAGYGTFETNDTKFVNAAVCDEDYQPVNAPVIVDL